MGARFNGAFVYSPDGGESIRFSHDDKYFVTGAYPGGVIY